MKVESHDQSLMKVHRENATWLGVVDIKDHAPVTLTIEKVVRYKDGVFDSGRKQDGQAIKFKESPKMLPLNATNVSKLMEYGSKAPEFAGRKIVLDVVKLKREFNGSTHGVRVVQVFPAEGN